ncbi:ATP-dependent helicase [Favolaschia claudopus]|uniref:DNA 3'-5' helicase n=1 Tax=Favolaschia claudopus TaxID=2862362 RepID=A0AAW0BBI2_9AGAR
MSGGALKTNIDEVLRHKTTNSAFSLHAAQPKTVKFKPATSNPTSTSVPNPLRKQASTTLPSFSTPGFGKSSGSHAKPTFEPINISSDSTPSPGVKRSSSDSFILSEQPSFKRLKSEKENISKSTSSHGRNEDAKGKSRKAGPSRSHIDDEDEPWKRMKTPEPDPFKMLDRDHPMYSLPMDCATPPPEPQTKYPDLLSKSNDQLNNILVSNHEYSRQNMEALCNFHSGRAVKEDIYTLEAIKSLLDERIRGIKAMLAHRETNTDSVYSHGSISAAPTRQQTPTVVAPPTLTSVTTAYESFSYASTSHITTRQHSTVSGNSSISRQESISYTPNPDSFDEDDALWADLDDVTLDYVDEPAPVVPEPQPDLTGPYAKEIKSHLTSTFGLATFRKNQFEAINAAMAGRDVFVLMPTGGGKSLCYQLPAVCTGGKTKGVTIVVSPLLALMNDQVNGLKSKSINAVLWTSNTSEAEAQQIRSSLYSSNKPTLLYVTPERLKVSSTTKNILSHLYRINELARFVVDEAHCISTWGQDFREAYQNLHILREEFPNVPIMALTATADRKTVDDILERLRLSSPAVFEQSFNRTNLNYTVVPKRSVDEMVTFIKTKHPNQTGVIYRTGRDKCEKLAHQLRQKGLKAAHFHARMDNEDKEKVQQEWKNGQCHIIVATIAFGMGIDKADVRFVIHFDLPKNMDGYYQETGRAGRDGQPANCVLYYAYRDLQPILKMIRDTKDPHTNPASIERQEAAVRAVVRYCENNSVCRRTQILQHFGEKFDKKDCKNQCNNCADQGLLETADYTQQAKIVIRLVQSFERSQENVTIDQCRSIFKGANTAAVRDKGHDQLPAFGAGKDIPKEVLELLFNKLLFLDALVEKSVQTTTKWHVQYLRMGKKAQDYLSGSKKVELSHRPKGVKAGGKPKATKASKKASAVPPPAPEPPQRPRALYADDDDPIDDIVYSPKKPLRQADIPSVVEVISDSEDDEMPPHQTASSPDPAVDLHRKLVAHREQVLKEDPSLRKDDVLDDETLQMLSVARPADFVAFKHILQEVAEDRPNRPNDAKKYADDRFTKYGHGFLHLCQGNAADPNWREKYGYRAPPPVVSSPLDLKKFKFKANGKSS